ncbi:MAG TPA: hypothetical protein VLY82_04605 [Nitrososphaerales archaeon]|nr:hypothetical protein [Nitrososphaerales archaeon]
MRPRGLHLVENHLLVEGEAVSASLFDFGLFLYHYVDELRKNGSGPYFYIPKLESHVEARLHALNHSMFRLARGFSTEGMPAFVRLQGEEFEEEREGYRAIRHQTFVGASYFDEIASVISSKSASTLAMSGSTEEQQFENEPARIRSARKTDSD